MDEEPVDLKLKERVRELKCLYALSKIIWEEKNDLQTIFLKTLAILPQGMQYPALSEVSILVNKKAYETSQFAKGISFISSPLRAGKKKYGTIRMAYKVGPKTTATRTFLPEEKKLLNVVASALSLYIKRASIEDDKMKLQMQLQQVERMAFVGELTAGIAHELNEPLGRILGFAQLIKKSGSLNEQQEQDIERILKASLYTREIIKKLMIFSRQMPQQITKVNLNETISNILYFMDSKYYSGSVKIQKKLHPNLPLIYADAVQMSQVLVNLLTNAIHAMPAGGEMIISTNLKKGFVSLSVKDNGAGMTAEVKDKIFEPFYTTKPVGQGTGLGLSVVQGIVTAHHGKINVSTSPGKGSKFEVLIPLGGSRKSKKI
jgi:two-component system, NtrC family, sensor kinase